MRKLVALTLLAVIVSSTMLPEVKQQASETFAQLKKTKIGASVLSAIQIQLNSNNKGKVDDILGLLNELNVDSNQQLTTTENELSEEIQSCDEARVDLQSQIDGKAGDIAAAEARLPGLETELSQAKEQWQFDTETIASTTEQIADAEEDNRIHIAAWEKSTRNHNAMIDALKAADALIQQLVVPSGFLQKSDKVLIQLQQHKENSNVLLQHHKNSKIFNLLMQMAQDVGIQADQGLVKSVVEIIAVLIQEEEESKIFEAEIESQRVEDYNALSERLHTTLENAKSDLDQQAEIISSTTETLSLVHQNIENWSSEKANLEEVLRGKNALCEANISQFNTEISNLHGQIDAIEQAIAIFEGNDVQDVKELVGF